MLGYACFKDPAMIIMIYAQGLLVSLGLRGLDFFTLAYWCWCSFPISGCGHYYYLPETPASPTLVEFGFPVYLRPGFRS